MGLNVSAEVSKASLMSGIDVSILLSVGVVSVSYDSGDNSIDIVTTCDQLGSWGCCPS